MQLMMFLFRNPAFWFLLILLMLSIYHYNKIAVAKGALDMALGKIESAMNGFLLGMTKTQLAQAKASKVPLDEDLLEILPENLTDHPLDLSLRDRIQQIQEVYAQLQFIQRTIEQQKVSNVSSELTQYIGRFDTAIQQHLASYHQQLAAYNQLLEKFPTGILAAMLNLQKLPPIA